MRILLFAAAALSASLASAQQIYKWVDENGVVQYGDRIPPEYADRDRAVLNDQGVAVGREEGLLSDEERRTLEQQQAQEQAVRTARAEVARRDRMLLETYLSVEDIQRLRDQRLEMLESQVTVTEIYLANLRERLDGLYKDASRYKPYSDQETAPELPQDLATEIASTEDSIASYEQTIERTRGEQTALETQFNSDIERFRELKDDGPK